MIIKPRHSELDNATMAWKGIYPKQTPILINNNTIDYDQENLLSTYANEYPFVKITK